MLIIRETGIEDYLDGGDANIKALFLGKPSAGKTRSASFWPKPIFADCEKGRMSIADRNVPYAEIGSITDMDDLLVMLKRECKKPKAERKYSTLVVDTLDAYQRIVIQTRLDSEKRESLSGWADWQYLDSKMTQFIAKLHQLPMNIVVNVHVKDKTTGDEDSKLTTVEPKLKGDLREQIAAEFDLVGYMGTYYEAEGGERVLKRGVQWHPDPSKPELKDRSGQLPKWTPITFCEEDYTTLFTTLTSHLDTLRPGEVLEELQGEVPIVDPPTKGGPIAGAPITPAPVPRKAAQPAAAKKSAAAPVAAAVPTTVGVQPGLATSVPAAAKPEIGGANPAPQEKPVAEPEPATEPVAEPAVAVEEAPATEAEAVANVAEVLGGAVASEPAVAESPSTDEAPAPAAEVAQVAQGEKAWPLCGTTSNEGEEGQPGTVPGCGAPVDPKVNTTEIGIFKTRTYLCPADFAAWRASTK